MFNSLKRGLLSFTTKERSLDDAIASAIGWAKLTHGKASRGDMLPAKIFPPSQETTGYAISTLYRFGEKKFAIELARWEASCQRKDGAFSAVDGVPYTFDTAQVIRGFLSVLDDAPEFEGNLRRACDFVERNIAADGVVRTPSYDLWRLPDGSTLSEYGNLYVLPPLLEAGRKLSEPKYIDAARRGLNYFKRFADLVEFKPKLSMLSHYFGYMMEALVDLGELDLAKKGLCQAAAIQSNNGMIPAYPGVSWVCSTGMAQLAVAWYKLDNREPADKALDYLLTLQNSSGGFYGGYGKGAQYFRDQEISWAVKYFLDACYWKMKYVSGLAGVSPNEKANGPEQVVAGFETGGRS